MKTKIKINQKLVFTLGLLLLSCMTFAQEKVPPKITVLGFNELIIAFAPIGLFILTTLLIFLKLKKEGYKIGDALKENETIAVTTTPPQDQTAITNAIAAGNPPPAPAAPVTENIQPKSSSRLLAFISGLVSIGLASVFCSFWVYRFFQTGASPDLSHITNVLLSLGLGVVPYAFNKISKAIE
jgi:hypothetical protein